MINVKLQPGDCLLVASNGIFGSAIRQAQGLIDRVKGETDPVPYNHAAIIIYGVRTLESLSTIRTGSVDDYQGQRAMVIRHRGMTESASQRGFSSTFHHIGKRYPFWRLGLFLLGLARPLHFLDWPVCSELVAQFIKGAGLQLGFNNECWAGVSPEMLEDAARDENGQFEIVWEGVV